MTPRTHSVLHAFILLLAGWLATGPALAQTTAFSYQGKLTDGGNPANGNYDLQFRLFDTPTVGAGTQAGGTQSLPGTAASVGVFNVTLDFGTTVFDGSERYLEIGVRPGGSGGPFTLLSPRQRLTSSPYAVQTLNATQLGGLPASRYVTTNASGNVVLGPANGTQGKLNVRAAGTIGVSVECPAPCNYGLYVDSNDANGSSITGVSTGRGVTGVSEGGDGVSGSSNTGAGVRGVSASHVGVFGKSTTFEGVRGESSDAAHSGVTGWQNSTTGGFGVFGYSQAGAGIQGNTVTGKGVVGGSTSGSGIYGESSGVGLTVAGVHGKNTGAGGIGVIGEANSGTATGVYGATTSASGFGLYGRNTGGGTALYVEGHARQSSAGGGMLKAMVTVNADGSIWGCWNGVLGLFSGNCGMSVSTFTNIYGLFYRVDFGFLVNSRYAQLTVASGIAPAGCVIPQVAVTEQFGNVVGYGAACGGVASANPVTIFVY